MPNIDCLPGLRFMAVTAHFVSHGKKYNAVLAIVEPESARHTEAVTITTIQDVALEWGIRDSAFALTADGASNTNRVGELYLDAAGVPKPLLQLHCAAHRLSLAMKATVVEAEPLVARASGIVKAIRKSGALRDEYIVITILYCHCNALTRFLCTGLPSSKQLWRSMRNSLSKTSAPDGQVAVTC